MHSNQISDDVTGLHLISMESFTESKMEFVQSVSDTVQSLLSASQSITITAQAKYEDLYALTAIIGWSDGTGTLTLYKDSPITSDKALDGSCPNE